MFQRFTDRARRCVALAQDEARWMAHTGASAEHLLLAFLSEGECVAFQVLDALGVTLDAARWKVAETSGLGTQAPPGNLPATPGFKSALARASRESVAMGVNYIGTEHLLLAVAGDEGPTAAVLSALGTDPEGVRAKVLELLNGYERPGSADVG